MKALKSKLLGKCISLNGNSCIYFRIFVGRADMARKVQSNHLAGDPTWAISKHCIRFVHSAYFTQNLNF